MRSWVRGVLRGPLGSGSPAAGCPTPPATGPGLRPVRSRDSALRRGGQGRRTDQQAAQNGHAAQAFAAHLRLPADPLVPGAEGQSGGGKADGPQQAVYGLDGAAHSGAQVQDRAVGEFGGGQFIPDAALGGGRDRDRLRSLRSAGGSGDGHRLSDSVGLKAGTLLAMARCSQTDAACGVQAAQGPSGNPPSGIGLGLRENRTRDRRGGRSGCGRHKPSLRAGSGVRPRRPRRRGSQ